MTDLYSLPLKTLAGKPATLQPYAGKVLLIVNVASKCGLTPQYESLERLYRRKRYDGLVVLGFPANNFLAQEPGTEAEIADFCSVTYDVTFPMFSKISVIGGDKHPLYDVLTRARPVAVPGGPFRDKLEAANIPVSPPGEVLWNFEKFLISRKGNVVGRFAPDVTVDDPRLLAAVDAELRK